MFRTQLQALIAGIVVGCLAGYWFGSSKTMDEKQLAAIIHSELRVAMERQPTSSQPEVSAGSLEFLQQERVGRSAEASGDAVKEVEKVRIPSEMRHHGVVPAQEQDEIFAKVAEADAVLAQATVSGQWSSATAESYRTAIRDLPDYERAEAYRKLAVAINSGQVNPDRDVIFP